MYSFHSQFYLIQKQQLIESKWTKILVFHIFSKNIQFFCIIIYNQHSIPIQIILIKEIRIIIQDDCTILLTTYLKFIKCISIITNFAATHESRYQYPNYPQIPMTRVFSNAHHRGVNAEVQQIVSRSDAINYYHQIFVVIVLPSITFKSYSSL